MVIIKNIFLFIFFLFSYPLVADDISEFQIEGMSIGDSALNFYDESVIKKQKTNWYRKNDYSTSAIGNVNISYKSRDRNYLLVSIERSEFMDISKCLDIMTSEVNEIRGLFSKNVNLTGPERIKHWADKSKKSWYDQYMFEFPNNDYVFVECYNWSDKITSSEGWADHFRVRLVSYEFQRFLNSQ